ncbi:MAG: 4a-hydroxytetrahydrobiopterin dehydratase [Anaerolineae bacterium]|nr:4a-hydroxytetrahydrobiopterin dehydratase [Phycisphaerae bacterium]
MKQSKLHDRRSQPLPKGTPALDSKSVTAYLKQVPGWAIKKGELVRELKLANYFETMSKVVAIAMLAQSEDHHPDMNVGYNKLTIRYSTHSVGGLSGNDFICAAKVNELLSKKS